MTDTITRNYAAEAVAIAAGTSRILPEAEHLQALAAQMESVLKEKQLLIEMLCAAMVDTQQKVLYFPKEDLERVRTNAMNVVIQKEKTEAYTVTLSRRSQPASRPGSARVN